MAVGCERERHLNTYTLSKEPEIQADSEHDLQCPVVFFLALELPCEHSVGGVKGSNATEVSTNAHHSI